MSRNSTGRAVDAGDGDAVGEGIVVAVGFGVGIGVNVAVGCTVGVGNGCAVGFNRDSMVESPRLIMDSTDIVVTRSAVDGSGALASVVAITPALIVVISSSIEIGLAVGTVSLRSASIVASRLSRDWFQRRNPKQGPAE